jgi:hypothetical protein
MRYFAARVRTAQVITNPAPTHTVAFGSTYLGIGSPDSTDELVGVDALRVRPLGQVRGTIVRVGPPTIEHRAIDGLVDPRTLGIEET